MARIPVETENQQSDSNDETMDLKSGNIMNENPINPLIQPSSEYKPKMTEEVWLNRCNKGMYKLFCQHEKDAHELSTIKWSFKSLQNEKNTLESLNKKLSNDIEIYKNHIDKLEKDKSNKEEFDNLKEDYNLLKIRYKEVFSMCEGDGYEITELKKINKDQVKTIDNLQSKIENFNKEKSNKNSLIDDYNHVKEECRVLIVKCNSFIKKNNELIYENDRLKEDKNGLNKKIIELDAELSKVKREAEGWHENKMQLIRELTLLKVGNQSHLQHDQLYQRFKQFKEQNIHDLTLSVFNFLSDSNIQNPVTVSRKQLNAIIKSHISEIVFISLLAYSNNDTVDTKPLVDVFFEKLKINDSANEELLVLIETTLLKGFELIKDISQATPPAVFYFAVNNEESFSEHKHEANLGCVEEGVVEFTIYPAYIVQETEEKQRIFEKALVWTKERNRQA